MSPEKNRLIEENLHVAKDVAKHVAVGANAPNDVRDDWEQIAAIAIMRTVDLPYEGTERTLKQRCWRNALSRVLEAARKWYEERDNAMYDTEPEDPDTSDESGTGEDGADVFNRAHSLNPSGIKRNYASSYPLPPVLVEGIRDVQDEMYRQCRRNPKRRSAVLKRLPAFEAVNKSRLIAIARAECLIEESLVAGLTEHEMEPLLLTLLELTQEETAEVLSRSREAVKKSLMIARVKIQKNISAQGTKE